MKNTFDGFLTAVKQHYEVSKNGVYSSFLLNPSPAQLRNYCLLLLENKLSKSDEEIFRAYFQVPEGGVLRNCIANFETDKFKAIVNFLKGKSERTNAVSINLIAILVDFQPRPFNKFLKTNELTNVAITANEKEDNHVLETFAFGLTNSPAKEDNYKKRIPLQLLSGIGILLLFIIGTAYVIQHEFYPKKECMQWKKDHFERVECSTVKQGFVSSKEVMPIDASVINLRKIEVNSQTLFFKNGKPLVWYSKNKGELRYFDSYGIDPETEKPLKPITDYMIKKYVLK